MIRNQLEASRINAVHYSSTDRAGRSWVKPGHDD
jgi:hypothetical protein